jgi:ribokinase
VAQAAKQLRAARVVVAQLEVPVAAVIEALSWGRQAGALTLLDPAPVVPLPDDVFGLVDIIRPNAQEAEALTDVRVRDRDTARKAAAALLAKGVRCAIVQAGDAGNLLLTNDDEQWLPRIDVKAVDGTGAGDAFTGTLAACLAKGLSLEEAAMLANAAAAWETTAPGAQSPKVSEA